jgi:hypothetical protein
MFGCPQNDVLIKYLLDELTHLEQDHSDAHSPMPNGFDQSRAGEASSLAPATTEEIRTRFVQLENRLVGVIRDELAAQINLQVGKTVAGLIAEGFEQLGANVHAPGVTIHCALPHHANCETSNPKSLEAPEWHHRV